MISFFWFTHFSFKRKKAEKLTKKDLKNSPLGKICACIIIAVYLISGYFAFVYISEHYEVIEFISTKG